MVAAHAYDVRAAKTVQVPAVPSLLDQQSLMQVLVECVRSISNGAQRTRRKICLRCAQMWTGSWTASIVRRTVAG
jgi:hypothetical protein